MQNKGLIKFLAWAFALVCLFQLSFTFVTNRVQSNAKATAENYINSESVRKMVAHRTQDQYQAQCMDHAGYRCPSAVLDIGCCSCNSTCSRDSAKEC